MAGLMGILSFVLAIFCVVGLVVALVLLFSLRAGVRRELRDYREESLRGIQNEFANLRTEMSVQDAALQNAMTASDAALQNAMTLRDAELRKAVTDSASELRGELSRKLSEQATQNEQKLDNIRNTMEARIRSMQEDNGKQLDRMRETVDEKLQKTLEDRIGQSFKLVSERLEQVYKGLGEMQSLAAGVGDLKKVLSNVKTRGILGEYQLSAILEEVLSKEQYETNVRVKRGSRENVEFAIRLPGDGAEPVYLPIDAKFPTEPYQRLMEVQESGDATAVSEAAKDLRSAIMRSASDISSKYINPPTTTNFAIMFLPVEGLYAEVVQKGMLEELQAKYNVNIAGPTTMAALLSSLQMGFSTLAIQKSSGEVARILGAVKKEFANFEGVLSKARANIQQVDKNLEALIGVRTRQINNRLMKITELNDEETQMILAEPAGQLPVSADSEEAEE
jgi:DNA recombination protein RmuC